ncbi:MAG: translation initiation factor IF-6 [Methanotrichaceae archaeon]|nr:translation initiation factor IF-6 [Methanotrichaceae archaeon]
MLASDRRIKIAGSSLLGVFARCTEDLILVPPETSQSTREMLQERLKVKLVPILIGGSSVIGSLVCGNSKGFVVTSQSNSEDLNRLSELGKVAKLPGKINAAGNVILANDSAALVHPDLTNKACNILADTLGVEVQKGTIGGLKTVGMCGVATNSGILVHPRASVSEIDQLENLFRLSVEIGTVNFGSPLVGSGLLANSYGYLAGSETTGPELGRIEDALGFLV